MTRFIRHPFKANLADWTHSVTHQAWPLSSQITDVKVRLGSDRWGGGGDSTTAGSHETGGN